MSSPVNIFKQHYSKKYGQLIGKIALDAGLVCPNREKGGCIYCLAESFTPFYLNKNDDLETQLQKGKKYLKAKGFNKYFVYFQQETTTAVATTELIPRFFYALSAPDSIGLIISTRPDYIGDDFLEKLAQLADKKKNKEILIELGLQSSHDRTLHYLNRNHTYNDFVGAVKRIQQYDKFEIGVHLILGLPKEDFLDMLTTVKKICGLGVNAIKFHHLQVIKGTKLHEIYQRESFHVFEPQKYLEILARLIVHVPRKVVIHRLWSSADPELLIAPRWNLPSHALYNSLLRIMEKQDLYQGKYLEYE